MTNDPRLERYLTALEQALKPFPVSDRAEVITEIKSHVLSALERDPQTRLDTVLIALGEPETVANRYLLERGLKPTKPSIHPMVKWLVIGFLGTFAMILLFAGFLVTRFSSLVKVDEKAGRVEVLGGLIDVKADENGISITGTDAKNRFAGEASLADGKEAFLRFTDGRVEVTTSDEGLFQWACQGDSNPVTAVRDEANSAVLDLSASGNVRCTVEIPEKTTLRLEGGRGRVDFEDVRFNLDARLNEGRVGFESEEGLAYKFDMTVGSGKTDQFVSSDAPDAHQIKVHVSSGAIRNEG